MNHLKSQAPKELLETLCHLEARSDDCFKTLSLLTKPKNQAIWAVLTNAISRIERQIAHHGDNNSTFDIVLLNLSRLCTIEVEWIIRYGKPASKLIKRWRWNENLQISAEEALKVANNYDSFLTCFPMWHKNHYLAESLTSNCVRFSAAGGEQERRVSAYQKGFRPTSGRFKSTRAIKSEQSPEVHALFEALLETCRLEGRYRFAYPDPTRLWSALLPEYGTRVEGVCRRTDSVDLGNYTLAEFKRFYVGLLSVCASHEHLCYRWMLRGHEFPLDSAVMIKPRRHWSRIISTTVDLPTQKCDSMIDDLTLGTTRNVNLHVHPFVPTDGNSENRALAPQFPLHSRVDDNILQTCSRLRPAVYDAATLEKEDEMRGTLHAASKFAIAGPATLPKPLPDVDLVVEDMQSSTVVIAEMKWVRKPTRPIEGVERNSDVLKGIKQLRSIKEFLQQNPSHLHAHAKMSQPLGSYRYVHFLLVARDHWLWIEPENAIAIVEFEPFLRVLKNGGDLRAGITDLLTYDWLPVENRDFVVRYDYAVANGVRLESQVFYPVGQ